MRKEVEVIRSYFLVYKIMLEFFKIKQIKEIGITFQVMIISKRGFSF